jgi:hypothetical protein
MQAPRYDLARAEAIADRCLDIEVEGHTIVVGDPHPVERHMRTRPVVMTSIL